MLKITNIPSGEKINNDFKIKLNGQIAEAYCCRVSAMPFNCIWPNHQRFLNHTEESSFIQFNIDEPVTLEITANKDFKEAVIRPINAGIKPIVAGRTITFTIEKAGQYSLELDGWHNNLHIFANPDYDYNVTENDENVIYFPAGVHHAGLITLKSNQTLYIDRDAVVYGAVLAINAENIKILGNGILDGSLETRDNESVLVPQDISRRNTQWDIYSPVLSGRELAEPVYPVTGSSILNDADSFFKFLTDEKCLHTCIHLYGCKNVQINGITLRDASGFTVIPANCENVVMDNIKIIGNWRYNSDGVDIFNSKNCVLKNSFLRCFDDCVVLKGIIGWDTKNMEDILIENCVIWCDWGASLEIGAETNAPEYRNITFKNCDCIHNSSAAIRIHNCDRAHVHNICYEDIRVEYSKYDLASVYQASDDMPYPPHRGIPELITAFFDSETYFSNDRLKGSIYDITYKNIHAITEENDPVPPVGFHGYDEKHTTSNIVIDGLYHNGKKIDDPSVITIGRFTENIKLL